MKRFFIGGFLFGLAAIVSAATFNLFSPATGLLIGNAATFVTTAATFPDSVTLTAGALTLVNDSVPTASEYYGTNAASTLGYYAIPVAPVGANPSASVGLTTVNGVAATFMRSDAAPPLSQTISPTMTGNWTYTPASGTAISVNAAAGANGILVTGSSTGNSMRINGSSVAGGSKGLFIASGTNASDYAFLAENQAVTHALFEVVGDGSGFVGFNGTASTLTWSAAGNFAISAPSSGLGLQVLGGGASVTGALASSAAVTLPGLGSSSAATTGALCWTTGTGNVTVDTTTTCLLSTRRIKKDIEPLDSGLDEVMKLRPVSYALKSNPYHLGRQIGLIAEDVAPTDDRLVSRDGSGDPLAVRYQQLTAVLVKAIQEQQREIEYLKRKIH